MTPAVWLKSRPARASVPATKTGDKDRRRYERLCKTKPISSEVIPALCKTKPISGPDCLASTTWFSVSALIGRVLSRDQ